MPILRFNDVIGPWPTTSARAAPTRKNPVPAGRDAHMEGP